MAQLFNAVFSWFLQGVRKLPGGGTATRLLTYLVGATMVLLFVLWMGSGITAWLQNTPKPFPLRDYLHQQGS